MSLCYPRARVVPSFEGKWKDVGYGDIVSREATNVLTAGYTTINIAFTGTQIKLTNEDQVPAVAI